MKTYRQLSFEEREEIALCERQGLSLSEIARRIGRHRSTVCRELKRNRTAKGTYSPTVANGQSLTLPLDFRPFVSGVRIAIRRAINAEEPFHRGTDYWLHQRA